MRCVPLAAWKRYGSSSRRADSLSKTHLSNVVLGLGSVIRLLVAGGAFCRWVRPSGAVQDLTHWIRSKVHIKEIRVPHKANRVLRYGRCLVLGKVICQTISTMPARSDGFPPFLLCYRA